MLFEWKMGSNRSIVDRKWQKFAIITLIYENVKVNISKSLS